MRTQVLVTLSLLSAAMFTVYSQCLTENDVDLNDNKSMLRFLQGSHNFSVSMFQHIYNLPESEDNNLFFSPYSAWMALTLAYFGSNTTTQTQLEEALGLTKVGKLNSMRAYKTLKFWYNMRELNTSNKYKFNIANRLYFDESEELRDCMQDIFSGELQRLDFQNDAEGARNTINRWVEKETANRIKDVLAPGIIDSITRMVLVNAAYFKGLWNSQFKRQNTKEELFYGDSGITFVKMMKQKGQFRFGLSEVLQSYVLELPYKGEDVNMYIFLPAFKFDSLDLLTSRMTADELVTTLEYMETVELTVSLPRFKMEHQYDLSRVMQQMGITELFDASQADLSGFTGSPDFHITSAQHKAFIEVNEEGAEAAAATILIASRTSRPLTPREFNCNHPFMYLIYDRLTRTILFMGTYKKPHKKESLRVRK